MRLAFGLLFLASITLASAEVPPELASALKDFRSDAPPGWSYTQTTSAEGKSTVERCDATKPEFERWTLVRKDDRVPSPEDTASYRDARSRRSRTGTAPKITDQLDLATLQPGPSDALRATYHCGLLRGEGRDSTSLHLRATLVLHRPSGTIESIELASTGAFSPTLGVKISELRTLMRYSLPREGTPGLPLEVSTRVRGTAFFFKSLDADMTVVYSDYERASRRPPEPTLTSEPPSP